VPCVLVGSEDRRAQGPALRLPRCQRRLRATGARAGTTDVLANPTAIVEVLSVRTEAYDRGAKWSGCQWLASLTDYLVVSQATAQIEQYQRTGPDAWSYRAWGPGEKVALANGAIIDIDAVYAGVFELDGE